MADTLTPNYKWVQPDVGGDAATWGATLNSDLGLIDAQVYANAQAGVPIGAMTMFGGATPPTNWLNCDGSAISATTYAALYAAIGLAFTPGGALVGGNFNLPNLQGAFPIGLGGSYALGAKGGEATHTLVAGEMPTHLHGVSDPTHVHGVSDPTHIHGVNDPTHAHGASQDAHNHTVTIPGSFGGGVGPQTPPSPLVNQGSTVETTSTAQPAVHIAAAGTGLYLNYSGTGVRLNASGTGISLQNAGGGAAHNNLPPYVCINFIIKYQ